MLAVTPFTRLPPKQYSKKLKADARAATLRRTTAATSWQFAHSSALPTVTSSVVSGAGGEYIPDAWTLEQLEASASSDNEFDANSDDDGFGDDYDEFGEDDDVDEGEEHGRGRSASLPPVRDAPAGRAASPLRKARQYYNAFEAWKKRKAAERRHKSIVWFEQLHEKEMARRKQQREDEERQRQRQEERRLRKQAELLERCREYEEEIRAREKHNDELQKQADRKIKKIDNLITLFQEWHIESHERNARLAVEAAAAEKEAERARQREEANRRRAEVKQLTREEKEAEKQLNKEVIRILWQTGAVLPPQKPRRRVEEQVETASEVTVSVRPDAQDANKAHALDLDLRKYRNATTLRGKALQTLGAVALAHQFFQGSCPRLQVLDLTACGIHLGGYNRLFLAFRASTVPHVHTLLLSQNGLPGAAVGLLEACLDAGGLANLQRLDMRHNQLGDKGAQGFAHILLAGKMQKLEHLLLQGNQIKFAGINAICRVSSTVAQVSPQLVEVNMLQNHADPAKLKTLEIIEPFLKF